VPRYSMRTPESAFTNEQSRPHQPRTVDA
jgi:hypothetical protein